MASVALIPSTLITTAFDPTKNVIYNPAAWENIPNGQFAADQSSLRFYRGVRQPEENVNFSRNFRFKERVTLNVRVEFNNILNRMRLPNPSTAGNFASAPTLFTSGANNGLYSGGFGTMNVLSGTSGQRTGDVRRPDHVLSKSSVTTVSPERRFGASSLSRRHFLNHGSQQG